ncbi:Nup93/Nic96 nuclear pore complex protein [Nitzschia inconspicua]|uniref:Nuclear pore protein n=1 Tax=Nitzschia inconspicua TaxID=303405 RepID=A0A9K3K9S7_9STRA|nr:Nup93/Nic96 nuclear pore complex protein [Nitzschia inconspicua]KAG7340078.1 Nup93/Nic96 nuclear pore complex protein [Nitzschia inconspicua]
MTAGTNSINPVVHHSTLGGVMDTGVAAVSTSHWQRSFSELAASSIRNSSSPWGTTTTSSLGPPSAAAQALLGPRTDLTGLTLSAKTRSNASQQEQQQQQNRLRIDPFAPNSEYGIERSYDNHRDAILERILRKQRDQTEQRLENLVAKRLEENWNVERERWKKHLVGNRNLGGPSVVGQTLLPAIGYGSDSINTQQQHHQQQGHLMMMNDSTRNGHLAQDCDPKIVKAHLDIVCEIDNKSSPDMFRVMEQFEKVALSEGNVGGYQTAWLLLREVLPNCRTPVDGALGTLTHLCRQYQGYIRNRVKTASLKGQDISTPVQYSNGLSSSIAAFVKLTTGSNATVWDTLYYCLRCGDAVAAVEVLASTPAGNTDLASERHVIQHILEDFRRRQGSNGVCIFQGGIPMIGAQERSTVLNMYENAKNMEPNNTNRIAVLALLSGQQLEAVPTIEDYIFGCLWSAVQDREDPVGRIKEVGESIRKWGPSYFATDDAGAWGYCLPLLSAQQFRTALSFLAEAGGFRGLLEAVHLGIVFSMANVQIADIVNDDGSKDPTSRDLVTLLLTNYAQRLEGDPSTGLSAALQYLLRIPSEKVRHQQIAALVVRSPDQVGFLAGSIDPLYRRQNAELDKFLSPKDVDEILDAAADTFKHQSSDSNKAMRAAELYMLAQNYPKLINFLIQLISPPDSLENGKDFWNNQARIFIEQYLTNRSTVVESLERANKMDLCYALKTMLQLRQFYDLRRQGKFEEAFSVVVTTELIPLRQEQVDSKTSAFKDLHPALKEAFPSMLTATVECLYEKFRRLKSESRGVTMEVETHLREIAMYARIIFIFSSFTNMPGTCRNNISQIRAAMV